MTARRDGRDIGTDIGNTLSFEDVWSSVASPTSRFGIRNPNFPEAPLGKQKGH
jgi:hypothetical protein